jgi:predicted metalloendopeptidase
MSYLNSNAEEYEQSLQQARVSLLNSAFDQFWIQSERSPLIQNQSSSSNFTTKTQSSWQNHVKSHYNILLILLTMTLLLISLPFLLLSQYHANRYRHQCSSLTCISTSHRIIENLNMTVNPCENFYSYACDGWINTHFLTPSETSISYFKEIYQKNLIILYKILQENSYTNFDSMRKLKTYFYSCMNSSNNDKTARETLLTILHQVGRSPLLSTDWSVNHFNLVSSLIYTHQHKINPLFRIGITIDDKNNQYHRIYFEQSGLSFDEKLRYKDETIRGLFTHFGIQIFKHLHSFLPDSQIAKQMDEIFLLETRLASIFQRKTSHNPLKSYHIRTYQQIKQWFSSWFDLETYLEKLFHKNTSFFSDQTFLVATPDYFEQLNQVIQTTPKRILANYITFQVIQELLSYMPESFNRIRRPLITRLKGITEEKQLWELCVKRTDEAFGFATGRNERVRF